MLKITNLEKATAQKMLMTSVNLTLHEGEIFALVGEHQSGKSLLSKLILTLSHKTNGKIKISANQYIGAFIPREQFMPQDSVVQVIKNYCKLRDCHYSGSNAKNILGLLNIRKCLHTKIYKLSPSQLDRLKIALPLILRTDILILDAPFKNLNPQEAKDLRVLLKKISNELKTSILITALKMSEIEEFCDTIGIIDDGMILCIQSYNKMIAREFDTAKLGVTVAQPNFAAKVIEETFHVNTKLCGDQVIVDMKPAKVQSVIDALIEKHIIVLGANRVYRSLDYQYWEMINRSKNYY